MSKKVGFVLAGLDFLSCLLLVLAGAEVAHIYQLFIQTLKNYLKLKLLRCALIKLFYLGGGGGGGGACSLIILN